MAVGRDVGGLAGEDVMRVLKGEKDGWALENEVRETATGGVEAVPCVTVQERFRVGGFQETEVFEALFDKIRRGREG